MTALLCSGVRMPFSVHPYFDYLPKIGKQLLMLCVGYHFGSLVLLIVLLFYPELNFQPSKKSLNSFLLIMLESRTWSLYIFSTYKRISVFDARLTHTISVGLCSVVSLA